MTRFAPIALSALALVAAGCGSGSSRLSDAAFTSKANAICADTTAANSKPSGPTLPARLKSEETILAMTVTQLDALSPPSNRAAAFKSLVDAFKGLDSVLHQLQSAVTARDVAKIASTQAGVTGFDRKAKNSAKAAGLNSCG